MFIHLHSVSATFVFFEFVSNVAAAASAFSENSMCSNDVYLRIVAKQINVIDLLLGPLIFVSHTYCTTPYWFDMLAEGPLELHGGPMEPRTPVVKPLK